MPDVASRPMCLCPFGTLCHCRSLASCGSLYSDRTRDVRVEGKKKKKCCSVLPLVGHSLSSMSESPIAEHMFKYKQNHGFLSLGVSWKFLYLIKSTLVCKALVQSGGVPILVSE